MSTIHLNPMSKPKHISRVHMSLRRGLKRILIALISTAVLTSFAAANEITFNEGYWAGQPIPNDQDFGCHMAMMLDDDTMMLIYANAAGRFDLGFSSKKWNILQEQDAEVYLDIDDQPITFTRVFLLDPTMISIRGTTPDDSQRLENLMRKASDLKVTFPKLDYGAHTSFYDNHLAVTALKNCIKSAQRQGTK